jgi:hypothetical protein
MNWNALWKIVKEWYNLGDSKHGLDPEHEQLQIMVCVWSPGEGRRNRSSPVYV